MRILWVATKPPWPPVDGGRLVSALTLEALHDAGHAITLVAPGGAEPAVASPLEDWCRPVLVPARAAPLAFAAFRSALERTPLTVGRHALPALRERVRRLAAPESFDLVHAEQVQAFALCEGVPLPIVIRAQNVESDLWAGAARGAWLLRPWLRHEAGRLAAWEGAAVRSAVATVALTARDALRLAQLGGDRVRVRAVPAPFPPRLPPAARPLPGAPAVVVFGSPGWRPNREGSAWFLDKVWPAVKAACPGAVLYLFGGASRGENGVVSKPAPADSRDAFAPGSLLAVPLHVASGVRMKVLEAWARGVPVVATPEAAAGLEADDGRELLLARSAFEFADAVRGLHEQPRLAASLVEAGRKRLEAAHTPAAVARQLAQVYASGIKKESGF